MKTHKQVALIRCNRRSLHRIKRVTIKVLSSEMDLAETSVIYRSLLLKQLCSVHTYRNHSHFQKHTHLYLRLFFTSYTVVGKGAINKWESCTHCKNKNVVFIFRKSRNECSSPLGLTQGISHHYILLSNTACACYSCGSENFICVYENYFPNSKQLNKAALEKLKGLSQDGGRALPPSIKTHRMTQHSARWLRSNRVWMRSSRMWMRSSRMWMRSIQVVGEI